MSRPPMTRFGAPAKRTYVPVCGAFLLASKSPSTVSEMQTRRTVLCCREAIRGSSRRCSLVANDLTFHKFSPIRAGKKPSVILLRGEPLVPESRADRHLGVMPTDCGHGLAQP